MTSDEVWDKVAAAHNLKNSLDRDKVYTVWLRGARVGQVTGGKIQEIDWDANIIAELSFSEVGFGVKE